MPAKACHCAGWVRQSRGFESMRMAHQSPWRDKNGGAGLMRLSCRRSERTIMQGEEGGSLMGKIWGRD